jgi:hypothetical protein
MTDRPYSRLSADDILTQMETAPPARRNEIAELLLYHTHERPLERDEQQRLFVGMVRRRIDLAPNNMLNARAAAAHKSLELVAADDIRDLLPELETALVDSRALPWRGAIRHNRVHVGFSLSYVLLLSCLFADEDRFDRAAAEVLRFAETLPTEELGRGFFRTAANLTKCLGLIALRQARAGHPDAVARINDVIRAALLVAIEARDLREALFPIKRSLPRTRLARSGSLDQVTTTNEFKENVRAHRISACLTQIADSQTAPSDRIRLETETISLCVSNAYPGERDAQIFRFNALFPSGGT